MSNQVLNCTFFLVALKVSRYYHSSQFYNRVLFWLFMCTAIFCDFYLNISFFQDYFLIIRQLNHFEIVAHLVCPIRVLASLCCSMQRFLYHCKLFDVVAIKIQHFHGTGSKNMCVRITGANEHLFCPYKVLQTSPSSPRTFKKAYSVYRPMILKLFFF